MTIAFVRQSTGTKVAASTGARFTSGVFDFTASTDGNTLIACIGANDYGDKVTGVTDDAGNVWNKAGREAVDGGTDDGVDLSVYYASGAATASRLTVSWSGGIEAAAVSVSEWSGLSNDLDVTPTTGSSTGGTSDSAVMTTATAADLVVAALLIAKPGAEDITKSGDSYAALTKVTTSGSAEDDCVLSPAYRITGSAGAQTCGWTKTSGRAAAWVMLSVKGGVAPAPPVEATDTWPGMRHEIGFTSNPNDPDDSITWTDVTERVITLLTKGGRDYDLGETQTAETTVTLVNSDGALDPGNASSPYYPNVLPLRRWRSTATWGGITYGLAYGYIERFPQSWENQFGLTELTIIDAQGSIAQTVLRSAYTHEIKETAPLHHWPLNDAGDAETLTFADLGSMPTPMYPVSAKDTENQGELLTAYENSGFRGGSDEGYLLIKNNGTDETTGYCLRVDGSLNSLPNPGASGTVTLMVWVRPHHTSFQQMFLLAKRKGYKKKTDRRTFAMYFNFQTSPREVRAGVYDKDTGTLVSAGSGVDSECLDGKWHQVTAVLSRTNLDLYLDGTLRESKTVNLITGAWNYLLLGGNLDAYAQTDVRDVRYAHAAMWGRALDAAEIETLYEVGAAGGAGEAPAERLSRLCRYAGWTGGQDAETGDSVLGAVRTVGKTGTEAWRALSDTELGFLYVNPSGAVTLRGRGSRYNVTPAVTFGDGPGEIHYLDENARFDYDPVQVINEATITRAGGATTVSANQGSIDAFFKRTYEAEVNASRDYEVQDRADWMVYRYPNPAVRVEQITVDVAADPDANFPVALGTDLGTKATVKRTPFGGAAISVDVWLESVQHEIGPSSWRTTWSASPSLGEDDIWELGVSQLGSDSRLGY